MGDEVGEADDGTHRDGGTPRDDAPIATLQRKESKHYLVTKSNMRYLPIIFALLLALPSCTPKANVFGAETGPYGASFDHYAINVDDVDESVAFYQKVLGLEEVHDGTEKDNIRWLSLGNGMSMHVIESDRSQVKLQKGVHLSISVNHFDKFVQHLRDINLQFFSWQGVPMQSNGRPDGVRQVYFKDLDGYWTEVNDARVVLQ
jgi:catechol 2,3-dioxygenase-like lactoylglutathione lyase family enzyme